MQDISEPPTALKGEEKMDAIKTATSLPERHAIAPPQQPGEWSLSQMQEALKRPLPRSLLKSKRVKGTRLDYIPWYRANDILDKYCPGWTWEIRELKTTRDRIFITGRLTFPTSEGHIYREATGTEELKREVTDRETGEVSLEEIAYGDPSSNAESMAFRRCAARFGLGLYLYEK